MRAGVGCTVQQALTPEAAAVVKQAVGLARRRGHAQVTPLHVAITMLSSSSSGLLRSACLRAHSHPLQCKALELCFNVALNRLPTSSSVLGGHHHHHHQQPSLSNALVAAFKRAQAHQRRGSVESQQQPLLAVKIELEQLVISILDDPSISRVMREASFSSIQVKANVEQAISPDKSAPAIANPNPSPNSERGEDVTSVVDRMASGNRRSVAVVGECLASAEGVVKGVMDRVSKGEVPELLNNIQFVTLPLFSFRNLGREEVEQKVGELRCLVKSCCVGGGAVLYLGDLSWAAEHRATGSCFGWRGRGYYCPVEHVIMEIRGLVCGGFVGESTARFWVMGIATYQTYTKCRAGSPSLESLLGLQALNIPATGLELSLTCHSDSNSLFKSKRRDGPHWPMLEDGIGDQLTCCKDVSIKLTAEARSVPKACSSSYGKACSSSYGSMVTSTLPSWLRQYKEENKSASTSNDQESLQLLSKIKWNSICDSTHKHQHLSSGITLHFSSDSPSSSSFSSYDNQPWEEQHLWIPETVEEGFDRSTRLCLHEHNSQSNPNSTSSSDTRAVNYHPRFKEINAENLKILCNAFEKNVPWQKAIIPEIASAILQCRSGTLRRKEKTKLLARPKDDTWLSFQGGDIEGKEKIARELASLVFGSHTNLVSIGLSTFTSTRSGSNDDLRNKRSRSEASHSYLEKLFEALRENPHRVFLVEDIEQVDSYSQMGIKAAIETGRISGSGGEEVTIGDAVVILSCECFDSRSRACSPPIRQRVNDEKMKDEESDNDDDGKETAGSSVCLDLNLCAVAEDVDDCSLGNVGLLESVDRVFFFKFPEDL